MEIIPHCEKIKKTDLLQTLGLKELTLPRPSARGITVIFTHCRKAAGRTPLNYCYHLLKWMIIEVKNEKTLSTAPRIPTQ
ncbi:hypothetical protein KKF84_00790, partial [Myxococcota bacterium]|nr:hypothetical protein [Myxococcota bacterium]MBU1533821.1 hypothetical protein [Myxococcota bacterium]